MEHALTKEIIGELPPATMRLLLMIMIKDSSRIKESEEAFIENQSIDFSYSEYKDIIKQKKTFYDALNTLKDLKIIRKKENTRSEYIINPDIINCSTYKQNLLMGLAREFDN